MTTQYGQLVRYVGAQHPDLAGCEGRIHSTGQDSRGVTVVSVAWRDRFGLVTRHQSTPMGCESLKAIRKFSKGIAAE